MNLYHFARQPCLVIYLKAKMALKNFVAIKNIVQEKSYTENYQLEQNHRKFLGHTSTKFSKPTFLPLVHDHSNALSFMDIHLQSRKSLPEMRSNLAYKKIFQIEFHILKTNKGRHMQRPFNRFFTLIITDNSIKKSLSCSIYCK